MPKQQRTRNKEEENERLLEEVRELKALNRSLLRQLKQRSKGIHREYDLKPKKEDYKEDKKKNNDPDCSNCGKGQMKDVDLAGRIFKVCNICKVRIKI